MITHEQRHSIVVAALAVAIAADPEKRITISQQNYVNIPINVINGLEKAIEDAGYNLKKCRENLKAGGNVAP